MTLTKPVTTDEAVNNRHPLKHFKGNLVDITDRSEVSQRTNKPYTILKFDFTGLEVIEANEPYTFPTTEVEIMEMNVPFSQWEAWKKSVRDCGYSGPIDGLIGKKHEWHWNQAMLSQRKQNPDGSFIDPAAYENRLGYCWLVVSIEGVTNTGDQLLAWIIDHADNRNNNAFKAEFTSEASIRGLTGYQDAMVKVISDQFLSGLVMAGTLTLDETGVYHKAG